MVITRSNWCVAHPFTLYEARDLCPTCAAVFAERERCAKIADEESEAPGDMPDDLWIITQTREGAAELMRAAIRATKTCIANTIRTNTNQPTRTPTEPGEE